VVASVDSCSPKNQKTAKVPYGTPEYIFELPPGYEDLEVIPSESQEQPEQIVPPNQETGQGKLPDREQKAPGEPQPTPLNTFSQSPLPQNTDSSTPSIAGTQPTLLIVIDDVGYNNGEVDAFLNLPFPLTLAVLPQLPHSNDTALAIQKAGKELILHQPMEAIGGNDPGPHAVYCTMDEATIEKTVAENIDSFPYPPAGMNNHMGSAVTRDPRAMRPLLKLAKERGMYYLDSLTAPGTVSAQLCREIGIKYMERNVFLDNNGDRASIIKAIEEGKDIARRKGAAVMIGHVWSTNLASTLMEIYPELVEQGYTLSTISQYMQREAKENSANAHSGN